MIKQQIEHLKNAPAKGKEHAGDGDYGDDEDQTPSKVSDDQKMSHLEQLIEEMNERLKAIENRLPPKP